MPYLCTRKRRPAGVAGHPRPAPMNMNREILRIALPNIVSNITVPLMGIVSTAIAGHWGADSAATIGALAIGVSIFNFIYWNCSFVRMGTSGLTAQAFGAGNFRECTNMLVRAMVVAAGMGLLMLALQYPLGELALWGLNGNEMTREYFYARIWAVPAGILLFGFNGWFTGMQNAMIPMFTAISVNAVHVLCSLWFAFGMDMGIVGIAYASVIAQWTGVGLSLLLLMLPQGADGHRLGRGIRHETAQNLLHRQPRHHAAYALHRGGLHLLHGGFGPHGRPGAAGREHPAVAALHALLVHERRLRICRRSADRTVHRRARRRGAARLPAALHRMGHGRVGTVRGNLHRLVARPGGAVHRRFGRKRRDDRGGRRTVYRMDHPDPRSQRHALHHGRHHGGRYADARHAQLDVLGYGSLFRHLLYRAYAHRQQRPVARLHAVHVPARRAAILHDAQPADNLPQSRRIRKGR